MNFEGKPLYEETAYEAMIKHYLFYDELNDVTKIEGYVTRNAIIRCNCGDSNIRLDAYKDHAVYDANKEAVLTCNDCQVDINIYRFGLCSAKEKYGKNSPLQPSGDKEMNKDGVMCYRCMPVLAKQWMQKEGDLLIWDEESEEFVEALKAGAYLTCAFGGIIEVVEVPEAPEVDNEEPEKILPLESKWLEEHTDGMKYKEYVTMDFLKELGWIKIADYFFDIETGVRSDWKKAYDEDEEIYVFMPDPEIDRHFRPIAEQDIINLNRVLMLYDITNKERICAFLSQITYECAHGEKMCERVGVDGIRPENTTRTEMKRVHEITREYPYQYRGGGAIHLTHMGAYEEFFREVMDMDADDKMPTIDTEYLGDKENAIEEEKIVSIGTEYVAYNYPWLSAGFFWKWKKLNATLESDDKEEGGILGVIGKINPGSENKEFRADKYELCKPVYDKYAEDIE